MEKDENLKEVLRRLKQICSWGHDGKEHKTWITQDEAFALTDHIEKLKKQINLTEEYAVSYKRKYEQEHNIESDEEIETLLGLE